MNRKQIAFGHPVSGGANFQMILPAEEGFLPVPFGFEQAQPAGTGKNPAVAGSFGRGQKRIRTAVRAFAELCLATRPSDLFIRGRRKYTASGAIQQTIS